MKKGVYIFALALVSLLNYNCTVFIAFASEPDVVITPPRGGPGEGFDFIITATSWSTVSGIKVEDPEGKYWVLKGLTFEGWRTVRITLRDAGDQVKLTWSDASISVMNDPDGDVRMTSAMGWPMTDFKWVNGDDISPHTQLMGAYSLSFTGRGCHYFFVDSFFVVPESPLGTVSILFTCIYSLAMYTRAGRTRTRRVTRARKKD